MNIFQTTLQKVAEGSIVQVNFERRSLRINGKYIIQDGKFEDELGLGKIDCQLALQQIEVLFNRYYHSIPSKRSESQRRVYFQALPEKELTDDDMMYGESRDISKVKLELYVLCCIINGSLVWDEFAKDKWFWQSPNYDKLILLKNWINH